jgi:hypothetical protein
VPNVFLSYRRGDTLGTAGRMFDRLAVRFGRDSVFMDFDSIPPGVDFRQHLAQALRKCDILLVLIGDRWVGRKWFRRRRLDSPSDYVRMEVEAALVQKVRVIPVIVRPAQMPSVADLPASLRELAFCQAIEVDPGRDFHSHMDLLIQCIDQGVPLSEVSPEEATPMLSIGFMPRSHLDGPNRLMDDFLRLQGTWEYTFRNDDGQVIVRKVKEIKGRSETTTWYSPDGSVQQVSVVQFALEVRGPNRVFRYFSGSTYKGQDRIGSIADGSFVYTLDGEVWTEIDPSGRAFSWRRAKPGDDR